MADSKITALTANTTPATTDLLPMVDDPSGVASTQKITFENFLKVLNGLTEDTSPDSTADFLLSYDTSASGVKKVKPSNLTASVPTDGWTSAGETWSYASASTFTISGDKTAKYLAGTRLKFTQTTVKYFVVVSSSYSAPNTTVTVAVNTSYTIANAAISSNYYSYEESPAGYPDYYNFTPTWTNISVGNGTVVARYSMDGKKVKGQVSLTYAAAAATTSITGQITIALPIASSIVYNYQPLGGAGMVDAGTALYMGECIILGGVMEVRVINAAGTYATWSATSGTVPFTWGVSDQLTFEFEYYV